MSKIISKREIKNIPNVILFLIIQFFSISTIAQTLKTELLKLSQGDFDALHLGFRSFAQGNYAEAYQLFKNGDSTQIPNYSNFIANSILYQNNDNLIRKSMEESMVDIPESYGFYLKFPEMLVSLNDHTAVPLNRNLFHAKVNGKDSVTVMLDTGGSGVGISEELVKKYDMQRDSTISSKGSLPAFELTFTKHPVIIPKLQIGAMSMKNIRAEYSVIEESSQGQYTGPAYDIIIGLDVFIGHLGQVMFDWENKILTFSQQPDSRDGRPFLFYRSKPFTSFSIKDREFVTVIDTGSPTDILPKEFYQKNYSKKEKKQYGQYEYLEYTIELKIRNGAILPLHIGDFTDELNLVIGELPVELLIGNAHKGLTLNLKNNLFEIR